MEAVVLMRGCDCRSGGTGVEISAAGECVETGGVWLWTLSERVYCDRQAIIYWLHWLVFICHPKGLVWQYKILGRAGQAV